MCIRDRHHCTYINPDAPLEESYVAFTDIHIRDMERNQILFPGHECLIRPGEKTFVTLSRLCSLIKTESTSCQPGRYFMLKAYVTQMILLLYREQVAAPVSIEDGYEFESTNKKYVVEQIIDYLDCHYNEKISLDQIARNMYLSPFYISKIFKSETGDTPINHLIKVRTVSYTHLDVYKRQVMMSTVFLKLTFLPLESVIWPSSNTCSRILNTSG